MLNKNFEKGITILEALVATAILGMIAMFFISSSSLFLGSQQTLVKQNKYQQLADLIIKDVSEYVKSEFNPYGKVVVDRTILDTTDKEENIVFLRGIDEAPKVGDIFLVEGVGEQFKIADDPLEVLVGDPKKIYEIAVEDEIVKGRNEIAIDKNVTFISFQKNELTCFEKIIHLTSDVPSDLPCEQDIKDLVTEWQNRIKADTKITYATIEMSNEGLLTVTLGDEINKTVIAKKFPQCAFDINISETEDDAGSVVFDFGGNIGSVETGIMIGNENPTHHYFVNKKNHKQYTSDLDTTAEAYVGNSCDPEGGIDSSPCRQNYAYLNTITVFLYKYDGSGSEGSAESATTPSSYKNDVWLQAALCKNTFIMPNGETWKQCDKIGEDKPDYEKVEKDELSLWFIFSEANGIKTAGTNGSRVGKNGHGYLGFRTSGLPVGARVLVFDDASESCYESINSDGGTKYKCDGGYDWNGKHDGLVLHLDKKVEDINLLEDVFLSLTSPSYNIKEWKVLKSGKNDEADTWTPGCLLAENVIGSAFDGGRDDSCWQTIESTFSTLKETISDTKYDELIIEPPYEDFKPENGFLRIGSELIAYDTYDADSGKFKGLVRGLFNKVKVMDDDVDLSTQYKFKNKGIQVGCVDKKVDDSSKAYNFITMETAYPVQKYREKLSLYNNHKYKELVDLRLTNVCDSDKLSGGGKQYSSPNMEMGRWYSWAHNETKGKTYTLIQRVKNNFVVTRDHQYDGGGNFSKGDIIYNELSEAASHSKGDRVYDGYPDINAPGIYLDNDDDDDKKFPNEMSKYTGIKDKEQLVISVPRKVQLRTSTAKPPSSIMTCT